MNRNSYFSKFPVTTYNGAPALNIMRRVGFNDNLRFFVSAFYPQTIDLGERIDSIAFNYYDSVDFDWIIYHVNDILDPYFQTPLSDTVFENFIRKKYSSVRNAIRSIAFFRSNAAGDDRILSTAAFESLLGNEKKYWKPTFNALGVVGYERSDEEFIASTNKIVSFNFTEETDGVLVKGEVVVDTANTLSTAEVTSANSSSCILKHVQGDFNANTTIQGDKSLVEASIDSDTFKVLQEVIPINEQQYYSPVSFYTVEEEKNQDNQEIYLLDNIYRDKVNEKLTNLLK
jgi:hypothetical protein